MTFLSYSFHITSGLANTGNASGRRLIWSCWLDFGAAVNDEGHPDYADCYMFPCEGDLRLCFGWQGT